MINVVAADWVGPVSNTITTVAFIFFMVVMVVGWPKRSCRCKCRNKKDRHV